MANLFRADEFVKTVLGPAIPGAQLFWCQQPANISTYPPTPVAVAFSDPGGLVPLTFPALTDGQGHTAVYLNPGLYTLVVAFSGVISAVYPDQSVGGVGTGSGIGTALALQVNGTPNVNQLLLNLQGQNSVAVSDAGNGTVNITGAVFQTNGTPNTLQSVYNLKAGANISLVSDAFGGVTITGSTQGSTFSTAGQGWFSGPGMTDMSSILMSSAAKHLINYAANTVLALQFVLQASWTISRVAYQLSQVGAGGSAFSFGIYNASGSKLVDATFDGTSASVQDLVITQTSVVLPAGVYYFAYTSTDNNINGPCAQVGNIPIQLFAALNQTAVRFATCANSATAGVLPATLGTLTAASGATVDSLPLPIWKV